MPATDTPAPSTPRRLATALGAPCEYAWVRWCVLRGLGAVALAAFVSLLVQLDGLLGRRGISPAAATIAAMREGGLHAHAGLLERVHLAPTLFWLGAGDRALHAVCIAGALASALLLLNVLPGPAIVVAWAAYLSLVTVGSDFLGYQWDALLLEALLCAAYLAPWRGVRPGLARARPASGAARWLVRLLVAKLMFLSGAVKWASHDPTWRSFTALSYHFHTQPLPHAMAYLAHQLPAAAQRAATAATLAIELCAPALVFAGRRARVVAFVLFVLLQLGIAATGNYGFFNALTIVLCISLLDDPSLRSLLPQRLRARLAADAPTAARRPALGWALAAPVLLASLAQTTLELTAHGTPPRAALAIVGFIEPFQSVNRYGLFAAMTTERPEIVVEGSDDGVRWRAYDFRYKPGPIDRAPRFAGLHMPRLDWQMWFAALDGQCTGVDWYPRFVARLLEGSPPVLGLLARDPFAGRPPRFVRSTLYDYQFASRAEHAATGAYWRRTPRGPYCPTFSLGEP